MPLQIRLSSIWKKETEFNQLDFLSNRLIFFASL